MLRHKGEHGHVKTETGQQPNHAAKKDSMDPIQVHGSSLTPPQDRILP
jgi:hypothetical protein